MDLQERVRHGGQVGRISTLDINLSWGCFKQLTRSADERGL